MDDLKRQLNAYLGLITRSGIIIVILALFFLFTNSFTDFFDTPKFLALLLVTGILLLLVVVRFIFDNKVTLIRTPLDIPILLLLAVAIVSTALSSAFWVSFLGNQMKPHSSLISLIVYSFFYFVFVNSFKDKKQIKSLLLVSTLAAAALAVITLVSFSGIKLLPAPWIHDINFTLTGSNFTTTAVLAMLVPFLTLAAISSVNPTWQIAGSALLALFGITIILTGSWTVWIVSLAGLILTLFTRRFFDNLAQIKPLKMLSILIPLSLIALVGFLSFIPPIGGAKNPLYSQVKKLPKENLLSFPTSWKISVSAFRDNPFWGSGPATYLFDFTQYKPIEFNNGKNWNLRFDNAFNEYLKVLAELGGIGLIALLSFTALFISSAWPSLHQGGQHFPGVDQELKTPLAISGLLFFLLIALHPSTLVLWVFGLIIIGSFMIINTKEEVKSWVSHDIKQTLIKFASNVSSSTTSEETIKVEALPSVLLTVCLGLVLFAFFFAGKFALADYHHRIALNAISQNQGLLAYNELVAAEKLNPVSDLYRIDLAQTNFALANAIASSKAPTEASPAGFLNDQDKQNIQVLLQQSITEGRNAVTLSPKSAADWEILGLLYRQIAGVAQNALVFSLDSYGKAIFADPLNPNLRLSVGGVYYAVQNYDLAIRFFTDAINLKPDFANGYYNLSVALRDKGDLNTAQTAAEKVLTLVEKDSQDYQVANNLLSELIKLKDNKAASTSTTEPPAAKTSGSLQNKELPKVVDVGNPPEKIATPTAIKKPNSTPEPTPQP